MNVFLETALNKLQWCAERSDSMSVDISPIEADALLAFIEEGSPRNVVEITRHDSTAPETATRESLLESSANEHGGLW